MRGDGFCSSTRTGDVDGRNIDPELGRLSGEGSLQRVDRVAAPALPHRQEEVPGDDLAAGHAPSYYGAPLLKEPVWKWYVPAYLYVGGVAGAAAALGAAAQLAVGGAARDRSALRAFGGELRLVRRCRAIATAGAGLSAVLLIADLGRPARFLEMLRVFRPTSPMNMGTWILSAFGASAGASTAAHVLPLPRAMRGAGDAAALGAGLMGLPLCTYTGVLIANTAVPIWQGTRRSLPVLFAASGAAGLASLLELWPPGGPQRGDVITHRLAIAGKALEVTLSEVFAQEAGVVPRVALPLRQGLSGALWRTAKAMTLAGLGATLLSRPGTSTRRVAGLLGTLGALGLRFAILHAGRASARDPLASSAQQRAGRGARDVVTEEARAGAASPALRGPATLEPEHVHGGQHA
jgi:formate-dependent nitrite reductase membrane component NrfD